MYPQSVLSNNKKSTIFHLKVTVLTAVKDRSILHRSVIRGIKHDFPFINIRKVPREVLKTEGEARGFQPSRGTLRMLMNDKIMFDRYYCINSTKNCENEENIGALYFITSPHFPTRVRYAIFGPRSSTHNLARALRVAW